MTPTHVIFDCDGVLVDSEMLSASVLTALMGEVGFDITPEVFRADFLGRSFANASARATQRFGKPMPDNIQLIYRNRLLAEMRLSLQAIEGVHQTLEAMTASYCLATSSSPERLATSLEVTGLHRFFAGRCSTSSEVKNGKPAPDLLFLAADRMGTSPENCLVIEDSLMGVEAAKAAGMQVWQFGGGSHMRDADAAMLSPNVPHIRDMDSLRRAFANLGLCREA
jgi:HAD superfamily hydrolase (TIGR01509 family)